MGLFSKLGKNLKKLGNTIGNAVKKYAPIAAPLVGTIMAGPLGALAGGAIGKLVNKVTKGAIPNADAIIETAKASLPSAFKGSLPFYPLGSNAQDQNSFPTLDPRLAGIDIPDEWTPPIFQPGDDEQKSVPVWVWIVGGFVILGTAIALIFGNKKR